MSILIFYHTIQKYNVILKQFLCKSFSVFLVSNILFYPIKSFLITGASITHPSYTDTLYYLILKIFLSLLLSVRDQVLLVASYSTNLNHAFFHNSLFLGFRSRQHAKINTIPNTTPMVFLPSHTFLLTLPNTGYNHIKQHPGISFFSI